eukprot:5283954-Prymnesium_polylepis.1
MRERSASQAAAVLRAGWWPSDECVPVVWSNGSRTASSLWIVSPQVLVSTSTLARRVRLRIRPRSSVLVRCSDRENCSDGSRGRQTDALRRCARPSTARSEFKDSPSVLAMVLVSRIGGGVVVARCCPACRNARNRRHPPWAPRRHPPTRVPSTREPPTREPSTREPSTREQRATRC